MSKRNLESKSIPPLPKKPRCDSAQPSQRGLGAFFQTTSEPDYPFARRCGIKVYTATEIGDSVSSMEQRFRKYWNQKAEEICANKEAYMLLKNNTAIQGAIHSAWILKKSELLLVEADHMRKVASEVYQTDILPTKLKTIDRNTEKLDKTLQSINSLYATLSPSSNVTERKAVGDKMEVEVTCIKKNQEALRKALERLRNDVVKCTKRDSFKLSCSMAADEDIQEMVEDVKVTTGSSE